MKSTASLNLALFVVVAVVIWFWLGSNGTEVGWLTVETPPRAIAGESLPIRVNVVGLKETTRLCVDLHWSSDRDSSKEFLASGGSKSIGKEGGIFDFEIMVRPMKELRFVHGIIYLSPTGNWDDHTFVARTDLVPVTNNRDGSNSTLTRRSVDQLDETRQEKIARPSSILRWVTGTLLLTASVLAWMSFHYALAVHETLGSARRWWLVLATGLVLAAAWEILGLEDRIGNLARAWARAEDVYYPREWFQRMSISIIFAAATVVLGFVWRNRLPCRSPLIFFGLYLAILSVNLLSLHTLDKYAGTLWHGVSLVDGLKLVCAAAVLAGTVCAREWTGTARAATTE